MKLIIRLIVLLACMVSSPCRATQEIDPDLSKIRQRLTTIDSFKADLKMEVDIDFINMPVKYAKIEYAREDKTKVHSDDFALIPKRGLDISFEELFKHPFITVDRGTQKRAGRKLKMLNIIPTSDESDFSIATLLLDTKNNRIAEATIHTLKDGTYSMLLKYENNSDLLPQSIVVEFQIERIRIPLKYMGKEVKVDKKKAKSDEVKTGKIILTFSNYEFKPL